MACLPWFLYRWFQRILRFSPLKQWVLSYLVFDHTSLFYWCYRKITESHTSFVCMNFLRPDPWEGDRVSGTLWPTRPYVTFHHARSVSSHEIHHMSFGLHTSTRTCIHSCMHVHVYTYTIKHTYMYTKNTRVRLRVHVNEYTVCFHS